MSDLRVIPDLLRRFRVSRFTTSILILRLQQSQGYIQQIEEEIERLQQLVEQVKATIHSEEELENGEPKRSVRRKYTAKKAVPKKKAVVAVQPKRRGRPKKSAEPTDA